MALSPGATRADLELSTRHQWLLLVNSWLLPVLLMVVAAVLCSSAALPEGPSIVMIMTAFGAGIGLCRRLPVDVLKISESES